MTPLLDGPLGSVLDEIYVLCILLPCVSEAAVHQHRQGRGRFCLVYKENGRMWQKQEFSGPFKAFLPHIYGVSST